MTTILRPRAGTPRFARLLRNGASTALVAFGTSLTLAGAYLDRLPSALGAAYGDLRLTFVNRGRNGYMTLGAAFRVADDVLPHAPDLVLIEFAHNDVTQNLIDYIPAALEGIMAQIRRNSPHCEFVFVYLALAGLATGGPTPAMLAYERVAERRGIPSIDLARYAEELVANGDAVWCGDVGQALTDDGIHHSGAAASLLGDPFAAAFVELLGADGAGPVFATPRAGALTTVARVRAADYLNSGVWAVRPLRPAELRGAGIDEEGLAEALEPGAKMRLTFTGTNAFIWAAGNGALEVGILETGERYRFDVDAAAKWVFCSLMETHSVAQYTVEVIALHAGLRFGDLGLVGTPE